MRGTVTRILVAIALMVSMLAQAAPAAAGEIEWCAEDPIITVDGTVLAVTTAINTSASNVSRVDYVVTVPRGSTTSWALLLTDTILATVTFRSGAHDRVRVQATVQSSVNVAVVVTIVGGERTVTKAGTSNRKVTLSTTLPEFDDSED